MRKFIRSVVRINYASNLLSIISSISNCCVSAGLRLYQAKTEQFSLWRLPLKKRVSLNQGGNPLTWRHVLPRQSLWLIFCWLDSEIMARPSGNLRINDFFKKTNFMEKKPRNPLKRCLKKQSNMSKALTGSHSLKWREALEKPKFPDPSNLLIFYSSLQGCKEQYFFRNTSFPKENWNNL